MELGRKKTVLRTQCCRQRDALPPESLVGFTIRAADSLPKSQPSPKGGEHSTDYL